MDESGRDKALESGSKIACMVSQVLFHDQVRTLEKSSEWTQAAMEIFLASFASEDYEAMASTLVEMGATEKNVDSNAFARDLQKDPDTEIVVATARGPNAAAVSANVVVNENQMNALFLDLVRVSESYGLKFPREFALLIKQLLYFDHYTRLLAPNMNLLQDQRITVVSNGQRIRGREQFQ